MLRSKQSNFVKILFFSVPFALLMGGGATASETVTTNVNVAPSLTLNLSASSLSSSMDPSSHTFDYKDLAVSVATNNKTGY